MKTLITAAFASGLALLAAVEPAQAQYRRGGGVGVGVSVSTPWAGVSYYSGSGPYWGSPYYPSYGYSYPTRAYGFGFAPRYRTYYSTYPHTSIVYSSPPAVSYTTSYPVTISDPVIYSSPPLTSIVTSSEQVVSQPTTIGAPAQNHARMPQTQPGATTQSYYSGPPANSSASSLAQLRVLLPAEDAQLWVDDQLMETKGIERTFDSPKLGQGSHSYTLRAKWKANGQEVTRTRKVDFQAGQAITVDFNLATPEELQNRPVEAGKGAAPNSLPMPKPNGADPAKESTKPQEQPKQTDKSSDKKPDQDSRP